MIVVADTSPLNYLILIESVEVLPALYGEILVPPAVVYELRAPAAPLAVQEWAAAPPEWLCVKPPSMSSPISWDIDEGEKQAIDLARELAADIVLMDDFEGRRAARSLGLAVVGTLGVLLAAGSRRLIDFERAFSALEETSFQVSEEVKNEVLRLWRARRTRK